jgi:hypothetical protein
MILFLAVLGGLFLCFLISLIVFFLVGSYILKEVELHERNKFI